MKLIKLLVIFLVVGVLYLMPGLARASYITLPGSAGVPYDSADCIINPWEGTIIDSGSGCWLTFSIPIASGYTLSSVTLYYYDNSGTQDIAMYLYRITLSSDSYSTLDSDSDSSTSASVQSRSLTYGSATSSSYTYIVSVWIDDDTELRGIRIYYY